MPSRRLGGAAWILVALGLPWATRPHDGVQLTGGEEAHDLDHLSKFDTSKFGAETGHRAGTVLGLQQSSGFEASGLLSP